MQHEPQVYRFKDAVTARFAENAMANHKIAVSRTSDTIKLTNSQSAGSFGVVARLYDGEPVA